MRGSGIQAPSPPVVRPERPADGAAIRDVTTRAFAPMPFAGGDEQDLIEHLRRDGALAHSLVAEEEGRVVGHVAFSPALPADGRGRWFALGPVAVEPGRQRQGIGGRLIRHGLGLLERGGAAGCVLAGDPRYYARFGFVRRPDLAPEGEPAAYFMVLTLAGPAPTAPVGLRPLFRATG